MAKFPEEGNVYLITTPNTTLTEYVLSVNQFRATSFLKSIMFFCLNGGSSVFEVYRRSSGQDYLLWRTGASFVGTAVRYEIDGQIEFDDEFVVKVSVTTTTNQLYIVAHYNQYIESVAS